MILTTHRQINANLKLLLMSTQFAANTHNHSTKKYYVWKILRYGLSKLLFVSKLIIKIEKLGTIF